MAPVWVVLLTVFAVAGPLVAGWMWSARWQSRKLSETRKALLEMERELRAQRRELADVGARARGVARMLAKDEEEIPQDPAQAVSTMHALIHTHLNEMKSLRGLHRSLYTELSSTRNKLETLKPEAEARLSQNVEFQTHLAEITAERDQLKMRLAERAKDPRQRASRVALRNARQEIEELRFQLRMANRAILDLELQVQESKERYGVSDATDEIPALGERA